VKYKLESIHCCVTNIKIRTIDRKVKKEADLKAD